MASPRSAATLLALLVAISVQCGAPGGGTQPSPTPAPTPAPTPSPSPPALEPLRADGSHWSQEVLGLSSCCGSQGWPWISEDLLERWAAAGGNLIHIRLGPYWKIQEGSQFDAYEHLGSRADLARFRSGYWEAAKLLVEEAANHNTYLEIDLIDGWVMKPANVTLSPWHPVNNVQNEMHVGCDHMQGTLDSRQEQWVRKAVQTLGAYPNVIWQISNESGLCGVSPNWEMDVAWVIRDQEHKQGSIAHMIGTNSELPTIENLSTINYTMYHVSEAIPAHSAKPTGVNEYPNITPMEYAHQLQNARSLGTRFDLWLGDSGERDLEQFLQVVRDHKAGH